MTPVAAWQIARAAHEGQRYGARDYFDAHVTDVATRVAMDPEADLDAHVVAWLHDVLEDTRVSLAWLRARGLSDRAAEALEALTRRPDEHYGQYIVRVCKNRTARRVKFHDLQANLEADPPPPDRLVHRYRRALGVVSHYLEAAA